MEPSVNQNEQILIATRVFELVDQTSPWHRSLWQVGTLLSIREVIESAESFRNGETRIEAPEDFIRNARAVAGRDPVLANAKTIFESALDDLLDRKSDAKWRSAERSLRAVLSRIESNYLWDLADCIDGRVISPIEVDLFARLIAAHLLDEGLHGTVVCSRFGELDPNTENCLVQLLRELHKELSNPNSEFEFWIGLSKCPDEAIASLGTEAVTTEQFLEKAGAATNWNGQFHGVDVVTAVVVKVVARDRYSALESVSSVIARLCTRIEIGYNHPVSRIEPYLEITENEIVLPSPTFAPELRSIKRGKLSGSITNLAGDRVDDALLLLSPHLLRTQGLSIATIWAAAEGLLGSVASSGASVADRLADIVACSFVRDELRYLVRNNRSLENGLARRLRAGKNRFAQLQIISEAIVKQGTDVLDPVRGEKDRPSVLLLQQTLSDPAESLARIKEYLASAFRRVYYHRNFVMHAAKFDGASLHRTAQMSPRLIAAALDQVINAQADNQQTSPLDLAERAKLELQLVGKPGARPLFSLLSRG